MNDYALTVFKNNPDFAERLKEQVASIKKSHKSLTDAANNYSGKYVDEVTEGTKKLQLLLEEGKKKGFSEEEILEKQSIFYPTVRTPILNMLYFLMREHPDANKINFNRLAEDINKDPSILLEQQNKKYGSLQYESETKDGSETAPSMDEFIYGNLTHDMFKKIKKLKALSRSSNQQEAFSAYTKCLELCKEYGLDFDKIPCVVT
jgi:hypothetical protein